MQGGILSASSSPAISERLYTAALHALRAVMPVAARGEGKVARGIRGRRGVLARMEAWSRDLRDAARPVVWVHAPSVGEGLQARAVIEALRARRPDVQIVYTYFSPSAVGFARSVNADLADYLPLDLPGEIGRALEAIRPALIVFSKTDVWPNLTREAERRQIPMVLLSGTLPGTSSRMKGLARALLRPAYGRLSHVAAISAADADRFGALGVPAERRSVMGDARFDQVLQRAAAAVDSPWPARVASREHFVIVAGSTWPPDEEVLLRSIQEAGTHLPPMRLVLVPHEPTEAHLRATEQLLDRWGFSHQRLGDVLDAPVVADVVLVDRVGVLGDLYAAGDVAYVGGGWGNAGLHSVLEPAAFALPVLFGPHHANAREAGELVREGGAFSVGDGDELRARLTDLWRDDARRKAAGAAAAAYVRTGLGAAARGAEIADSYL